jgi:hypothetical protein
MKKAVNFINVYFGIAFIVLQFCLLLMFNSNGGLDYPMSQERYLELGGNSFDYYIGYNLFTCLDTGIYTRFDDKFFRFLSAGIPIILISLLWLMGVTFPGKDESGNKKEIIYKKKIFMIITTVTSSYYLYYSFVYLMKFFLQ